MIKIFDTLSKTKKPLGEKQVVKLYLCGPTVYNYIHIGNIRPVIIVDVLHRLLQHQDYDINYVHNITDIDDKIIAQAQKEQVSEKVIVDKYYQAYIKNLEQLNILLPTEMPKVSAFIPDIIKFINNLIAKDYAYISADGVYFSVNKISSYGALAQRNLLELLPSLRVSNEDNKKNPFDFVLWKRTFNGLKWDSPWKEGRPGWHTECVVFIDKIFHQTTIDFHGGGVDLKFPHHENERAQFLAAHNKELSKIWWHNGHVNFNNDKMSKSLGNVILVTEFCQQYSPLVLRYLMLNHDHHQPINFTDIIVQEAQTMIKKYQVILQLWTYHSFINQSVKLKTTEKYNAHYYQLIINYLSDNINTTKVLALINELIKILHQNIKNNDFSDEQQIIFNTLLFAWEILGFKFSQTTYSAAIKTKIMTWEKLKKNKDFVKADSLRQELQELGILPKI